MDSNHIRGWCGTRTHHSIRTTVMVIRTPQYWADPNQPFRDESKPLSSVPTFFYRLSFNLRSGNSFGKERDHSFLVNLQKPQIAYIVTLTSQQSNSFGRTRKKTACWLKRVWTLILSLSSEIVSSFDSASYYVPLCTPIHHSQSRVSNLSGAELITLGLCRVCETRTHTMSSSQMKRLTN